MSKCKKVIALLATISMMGSLVGCVGNTSGETVTGGKEQQASSKTGRTIEFWTPFTGADGENMNRLVEEYNNTNPTYKVVHRPIEANDLYTKIPTTVSSQKDVPDLSIVHAERIPLFVEQEVIMPLQEYIDLNGGIKPEDYVEQAWNIGSLNDNQYAVPLDVHSFVTYYNKDLLEKYGPNVLDDNVITIDEVKQVGEASIKDNIYGMGITWMRVKYLGWLAQLGQNITSDGETPVINTPEGQQILTEINSMVNNKITTQDGDDPGQLFRSGQTVFWPEGIWMQNSIKDIPNLNWGMTHFVTFDENVKGNWSSSHQFVMLKNEGMTSDKAEGVMDFIEWVGNNGIEWARAGQIPAALAIRENEEFKTLPHAFLADETESIVLYDYKYFGYVVEALDKVIFEAVFGRMTPEEALKQAEKEVIDRINALK